MEENKIKDASLLVTGAAIAHLRIAGEIAAFHQNVPRTQSVPKCCSRPSQIGAPHPVIGSHPSAATKPLSQPHEVLPTTTSLNASPGCSAATCQIRGTMNPRGPFAQTPAHTPCQYKHVGCARVSISRDQTPHTAAFDYQQVFSRPKTLITRLLGPPKMRKRVS